VLGVLVGVVIFLLGFTVGAQAQDTTAVDPLAGYTLDWRERLDPLAGYRLDWREAYNLPKPGILRRKTPIVPTLGVRTGVYDYRPMPVAVGLSSREWAPIAVDRRPFSERAPALIWEVGPITWIFDDRGGTTMIWRAGDMLVISR